MKDPKIWLQSGQSIERCKQHLDWYIRYDQYRGYDCDGAPARDRRDRLTSRQFRAVERMHAWRRRPSEAFFQQWCDQPLPELLDVPWDLDLIDDPYSRVYLGIDAIRELVRQMAKTDDVGDVVPTKALHLLRPRLVALSDSYVRECLGISEGDLSPDGYAARAVGVQTAMRKLGQKNGDALAALHAYGNNLPSVTTPLSKVRVLDMVLWSHKAR